MNGAKFLVKKLFINDKNNKNTHPIHLLHLETKNKLTHERLVIDLLIFSYFYCTLFIYFLFSLFFFLLVGYTIIVSIPGECRKDSFLNVLLSDTNTCLNARKSFFWKRYKIRLVQSWNRQIFSRTVYLRTSYFRLF